MEKNQHTKTLKKQIKDLQDSHVPRDIHRYFISSVRFNDVLMWVYAQNLRGKKLVSNTKRETSMVIAGLVKSCNPQSSLDVLTDDTKEVDRITSKIKYGDLWCIYKISPSSECIICKTREQSINSRHGSEIIINRLDKYTSPSLQNLNGYGIKMTIEETTFPLRILYYCGVCTTNIISIAEKCIFELGNKEFENKLNILFLILKALNGFNVDIDCCDHIIKKYIDITFFNEFWLQNIKKQKNNRR